MKTHLQTSKKYGRTLASEASLSLTAIMLGTGQKEQPVGATSWKKMRMSSQSEENE